MTIKNTESSALSGKQTTGLSLVKRLPSWFSYLDLKSYYCRSARGLKAWCERDRAAAHRGPHPNSTGHRAFPFLTMEWDVYGMLPASFREGSISCLFGKGTNMLHIATDLPPSLDFRSMGLGGCNLCLEIHFRTLGSLIVGVVNLHLSATDRMSK